MSDDPALTSRPQAAAGRASRTSRSSPACPAPARRPPASCSRTSATRSSTTCPPSCCATWPSWWPTTRSSSSAWRSCSTSAPATRRSPSRRPLGALEARGIKPQVFFLEARDEVAHPALQRDAPPPPARHRRQGRRRLDRARARAAGRRARRGPRHHRHVRPVGPPAAGAHLRRARRPTSTRRGGASSSSASASSTACRSKRTSSSTSASWRTRSTSPELRPLTGLDEPVREFVLAQPVTRAFLAFLHDFLAFAMPGLPGRGQGAADHRHRLHRRLPPLGRHRRGGRAPTCASRARGR